MNITELTKEELSNIDGGWNLLEYAAYGIGAICGAVAYAFQPTEGSLAYGHQGGA